MDLARFGEGKTGELVRISIPDEDWAFVPEPLPPRKWDFPAAMWPLLSDAKAGLARLDGIGRTLESPELLLSPLQGREALRSSKLEGTIASPHELLLFELQPRSPSSSQDPTNDQLEVANYRRALKEGVSLLEELPMSLRLIRQVHRTLLHGVRGKEKNPGEFRRHQVHIGRDRRFIPPPPHRLDECLDRLEKHIHEPNPTFDPLVRAFLLHYQFEAIHPFSDGNGRIGRVLLSLMVYKWCRMTIPWLYLSPFFDQHKDEYIERLFRVSTNGEWEPWVEFCLRGTIEETEDSVRRCADLISLRKKYHGRAGSASPRTHPLIDSLFVSPLVTIPLIARMFDVTYPTAKADIDKLIRLRILKDLEWGRPNVFYAPGIMEIAFDDAGPAKAESDPAPQAPPPEAP